MSPPPAALRTAIVGAGLMGRWHAHAVHRSGGRVVAVVDPDTARARALAARLPSGVVVETDLQRAIELLDVQVLHVSTPAVTHEPIARQAIAAGVHLLVEKPLASDAATVEQLHALAEARGVLLCPVHQFLFQPGILRAIQELPALGAPRQLDVVACSAGADGAADPAREAVALDILPHGLALARRLLGHPLDRAAWRVGQGPAGELRAITEVGPTSVMLAVSMRARPTENSLVLRCDLGTVRANLYHGFATVERGTPSRFDKAGRPFLGASAVLGAATSNLIGRATRREPAYPGLRELVARFYRAIAQHGSSPIAVEESVEVARARDTIARLRADAVR